MAKNFHQKHKNNTQDNHYRHRNENLSNSTNNVNIAVNQNLSRYFCTRLNIIMPLLLLILTLVFHMLSSMQNGDLFFALAGGQEIMSVGPGKPDFWSYTASGTVWLNQSWASDVILYLTYKFWSFNGLVALKALLLALVAALTFLLSKSKHIPFAESLLAAGIAMSVTNSYTNLRPNLIMMPVLVLCLLFVYKSNLNARYIWAACALVIVWSNLHGSYILGLFILFLWALNGIIRYTFFHVKGEMDFSWQPSFAVGIAFAGSLWLNPFGLDSLKLSLSVGNSSVWRSFNEWKPIWEKADYGNISGFVIVVVAVLILFFIRYSLAAETRHKKRQHLPGLKEKVFMQDHFFEICLYTTFLMLAMSSRRLIAPCLIVSAPFIAQQIFELNKRVNTEKFLLILTSVVMIYPVYGIFNNLKYYSKDYPFNNQGTFFEKMHMISGDFPVGIAKFIRDNKISGNTFNEWKWEGYLRLFSPGIKLYYGGRGGQIYGERLYLEGKNIIGGRDTLNILKRTNTQFIAIPYDPENYGKLMDSVINKGSWVVVYMDGMNIFMADIATQNGKNLIDRMMQNQLQFDDEKIKELSLAACYLSPVQKYDEWKAYKKLETAVAARPCAWGYIETAKFLVAGSPLVAQVEQFLLKELDALEKKEADGSNAYEMAAARELISGSLADYYQTIKANEKLNTVNKSLALAKKRESELKRRWPE